MISAYVPCFNNEKTVLAAVESLQQQDVSLDQLFVIDDHSLDESVHTLEKAGIEVVKLDQNMGRGAVRHRALLMARHEYVLSCDATNRLCCDFAVRSLRWLQEQRDTAAVFGRMSQADRSNVAERWRGRHLFKEAKPLLVDMKASLATWGVMMRRSAVMSVGNFDPTLRQSEDRELGARLIAAGYKVVFDPSLTVVTQERGEISRALERFWRWHANEDGDLDLRGYLKEISYSVKVMAKEDLAAGDPMACLISLIAPHYKLYRSALHRFLN